MDLKKSKRFLITLAALYWVLVAMIYLVAGDQFHHTAVTSDALSPIAVIGEINDDIVITQQLIAPADQLTGLDIMAATYGRANSGTLNLNVKNAAGDEVALQSVDVSVFTDGKYTTIPLEQTSAVAPGEPLTLTMSTQGCAEGNAVTIYYGNMITAGRFDIVQSISQEDLYTVNGTQGTGKLCIRLNGIKTLDFYRTYWLITAGIFVVLGFYALQGYKKAKMGKNNGIVAICTLYCRYRFLLKQLVSRDFKAKYKRSVLGMAWSFLNPLLTMAVQYVVFSTLFKSDTPNYPVYLLSGIVFFNFFSEAVSVGMTSITGNASLIKKVYMPKYIYPFSKLFSSLINFGLALIPLFLVMLVTGTAIRPSVLLLLYDIFCLLCFVMGMILLLSTAMTFFQDTQFLWGVISMLWMYLTPLFYPESIIPQSLLTLYHMNPMYQYITFARICIIDGVSPEPMAYLWCLLSSVLVLLLGIWTFKKQQDKFVLYL